MSNFYVFHGIDHKVGVTMVAQSIAEIIASYKKGMNVLFLALNGRLNAEYVKEEVHSIDDFKVELDSKIFTVTDFMRKCRQKDNFYMMAGVANEEEERLYFPSVVEYLLGELKDKFDVIIADTGSTLDNGLALGALLMADCNYLITTQQESALTRLEKQRDIFDKSDISFDAVVVNKFYEKDPHSLGYIRSRMGLDKERISKISMADYERQAEMNHCTLMEFNNSDYEKDILNVANEILLDIGGEGIRKRSRGLRWKSFI
ncbi:MAG: hypothetical protein HXK71_02450 [Clostridiales bacterium]|jgi:hypothetical protein|nr:hypothetical protein [Clostridiales bacterium]